MIIDYIFIIMYFLFVLILGLFKSTEIKTIKDYAVSDRNFNTAGLAMTFLATSIGVGSVIGDLSKIRKDGIIFYIGMSGFFLFCILMAKYIAPHFDKRFKGMISAGDIMKYFYGRKIELFTAVCGFLVSVLSIGAQLTVIGHVVEYFFNIKYQYVVLGVSAIITFYSAFGGIKAITTVDVFSLTILLVILSAIAFAAVQGAGGYEVVIEHVLSQNISDIQQNSMTEYGLLFFVSILPFLWIYPPIIQRFLMAKKPRQISKVYIIELIFRSLLMLTITGIAFATLIIFPNVESKSIFFTILDNLSSDGVGGLIVLMVLAVGMSTADSHLNAGSVLIANNLFQNKDKKTKLDIARISGVLIGALGTLAAMLDFDIVEAIILIFSVWGASVGIPLIAAVLRFPVSRAAFWLCSGFSFIGMISALIYLQELTFIPSSIGIITGCIGFLIPYLTMSIKKTSNL